MTYRQPELTLLGSVRSRFRQIALKLNDWRVRKLERNIGQSRGLPALRLAEASRQFGVTPDHLGRLFKQQVGVNFRDFTIQERIEHAAAMLIVSGRSVKEIAAEAGYQHPSDFSRKFKHVYGVTPQEFRRRPPEQLQQC